MMFDNSENFIKQPSPTITHPRFLSSDAETLTWKSCTQNIMSRNLSFFDLADISPDFMVTKVSVVGFSGVFVYFTGKDTLHSELL